jgi:VCBS repeat-containing protein
MAIGPQLAGIQPNGGELLPLASLSDNRYDLEDVGSIAVLSTSPRELRLAFDEGQVFAAEKVKGIQISRAGNDKLLGTADDVVVAPSSLTGFGGFAGADASPNENVVVVRFAETLPDDLYRVEVFGVDNPSRNIDALRNTTGQVFVPAVAGADRQTVDFKLSLGAQVVAVVPQPTVSNANGTVTQSLDQIEVYFNNDDLWPTAVKTGDLTPDPSVVNPTFYRLIFTQDTARNTDDLAFSPTTVSYDPVRDRAVLTFARPLHFLIDPATATYGTFRLRVGTNEVAPPPPAVTTPTANVEHDFATGETVKVLFQARKDFAQSVSLTYTRSDLGFGVAPVVTVVGQRVFVTLNSNGASPTTALQLMAALAANPAADALLLATVTVGDPNTAIGFGAAGPIRLALTGLGSSFSTASDLGKLDLAENQNQVVNSAIDPQPFQFAFPGDKDEPGHRELPAEAGQGFEQHISYAFGVDTTTGVRTIKYNFRSDYGRDPTGNTLANVITDAQRQRVREAFELWARYLGVQFLETANEGLTMATGDLRALNTAAPDVRLVSSGVVRVDPNYVNSLMVLDTNNAWTDTFGDTYFRSAMQSIGFMLGLGSSPELPGANESIFPNDNDVLHGQLLHRPDSNDIDLYRFTVDLSPGKTGVFTAETFAERQADSSLLDSTLRLYRETPAAAAVAETDFNSGGLVGVRFTAVDVGRFGNELKVSFSKTDRGLGQPPLVVVVGSTINVDLNTTPGSQSRAADVVNAIALNADAAALVRAQVVAGDGTADITPFAINYSPLSLAGGANVQREVVARNDDYYSKDSFLKVALTAGTYYLGVSAAGNDVYDPTVEDTGFGGRTQGSYRLQVNFRPQADAADAIRDLDRRNEGLPGTPLDGDGDGQAGGLYNFWFQTRNQNRVIEVLGTGASFTDGQIVTITDFQGVVRRFEVNKFGGVGAGNVAVAVLDTDSPATIATSFTNAINSTSGFNRVFASASGSQVTLTGGDRTVALSSGIVGLQTLGKTIFVNKTAGPNADGSLSRPFNNISSPSVPNAFAATLPGDIVRIVGNGGSDNNFATPRDNFAYEIGFGSLPGQLLTDGTTMEVPKGVTVMVDAGAIFKLRAARIAVGSSTLGVDRSGTALQVLGTPERNVVFTSWLDENFGRDTFTPTTFGAKGDWGGIVFQNDLDKAKGQEDYESRAIFLNYVNNADFRFGGGVVNIDSVGAVVQPVQMIESRPTLTFNRVSESADSAFSADPDSFRETQFNTTEFQLSGAFTPEYGRVGPEIRSNRLSNNSINGLFVRISTPSGSATKVLSTQGRFDDTDIVHYIPENLTIRGTPGGPLQDTTVLPVNLITLTPIAAGTLPAGTYSYRFTLVDANGYEAPASAATASATLATTGGVRLNNLPAAPAGYIARRIYRSNDGGASFQLAVSINSSDLTFFDSGRTLGGGLDLSATSRNRPRLDARLAIDPGTVVKLEGSRIEVSIGGQLIAEGLDGQPVIFTSKLDDRYGAGGTFDTNNDNAAGLAERVPAPGDWGGIYIGHTSRGNIDRGLIAFGGGITKLEGTFGAFNAIEVQQGDLRLANSVLEGNASGVGGQGPGTRLGRLDHSPAVVYVRGAQPTLANNIFRNNDSLAPQPGFATHPAISVDVSSLNSLNVTDPGRESGAIARFDQFETNSGPLVRLNRLARNGVNGLEVRGGTLATEGIWDDTDIVHVLTGTVTVGNLHTLGGLRLQSSSTESLVVKVAGGGFTATGTPLDINDRIGGSVYVLGQPGHPVVLTSFHDDSIGAGLQPDNTPQTDTNNNGLASIPRAADWRSILLDQNSNDRNVEIVMEVETPTADAPGSNASPQTAQVLGSLAQNIQAGDENLRLGFQIQGFLNDPRDVDVYSFTGYAGTEVWLDIDRTNQGLDSILELLNADGFVVARSNDSPAEQQDGSLLFRGAGVPSQFVNNLVKSPANQRDFGTLNPRDAGMRVVLPGTIGTQSTYHFRIRSSGGNLNRLDGGETRGNYTVELRMRETDETPGSTVRYADIRYATNGVEAYGLPAQSPLTGEVTEDSEIGAGPEVNNGTIDPSGAPGSGSQFIGNVLATDRATMSIGGSLTGYGDIDFYEFRVNYTSTAGVAGPQLYVPMIFDVDYADGFTQANTSLAMYQRNVLPIIGQVDELVLIGRDSNVAEDRARPLSGSDLDDLSRGSGGSQDPFIGVVDVPSSSTPYYMAVHHNQQMPEELTQFTSLDSNFPLIRLEPVNSVRRIADDRIGTTGGTTADPPVVPALLNTSFVGGPGNLWGVTSFEPSPNPEGHGLNPTFDGSRDSGLGQVYDNEGNDSLATAQVLDGAEWSLVFDPSIGDQTFNSSTFVPHITVNGRGDGTPDFFRFNLPTAGGGIVLDIDGGSDGQPGTINTRLRLYDSTGTLIAENDDASTTFGSAGSTSVEDAFIDATGLFLAAGDYIVEVVQSSGDPPAPGQEYVLQVSVENHPLGPVSSGGGQSFAFRNPGGGIDTGAFFPTSYTLPSNAFSLAGYSADDKPMLYFTYFLETSSFGDALRVYANDGSGRVLLASSVSSEFSVGNVRRLFDQSATANQNWRQARIDLGRFAGAANVNLEFEFRVDGINDDDPTVDGAFIDDLIIGFAERGEMVTRPASARAGTGNLVNNPITSEAPPGEIATGAYQLEMRLGTPYASGQFPSPNTLRLDLSFDTNDRLSDQLTMRAPAGAAIVDGETFVLGDGIAELTFEFDGAGGFNPDNVRVPFSVTDSAATIAARVRDLVNSPAVRGVLKIQAASADGTVAAGVTRDSRINFFGNIALRTSPGSSVVAVRNDYFGDANIYRDQGQLLIQSNFITDSRDFGVVIDAGTRDTEPGRAMPYMQSHQGPVRKFPALNNRADGSTGSGGIVPGAVVQNNVIYGEGLGGVHISGDAPPVEISIRNPAIFGAPTVTAVCPTGDGTNNGGSNPTSGDVYRDGESFVLQFGDRTLTFEFEEVAGGSTTVACAGSGTAGGNGYGVNNIPVFFRHTVNNIPGYSVAEMAGAIASAISSAWFAGNGTTYNFGAITIEQSRGILGLAPGGGGGPGVPLFTQAVYVGRVSNWDNDGMILEGLYMRRLPVGQAPVPLVRVINNTILGDNGNAGFNPQPNVEANDTIDTAIDTKQGRQMKPNAYVSTTNLTRTVVTAIGDNPSYRLDPSLDVDFYKFQMNVGDTVAIDIDTIGPNSLNSYVRLFDEVGREIAVSDNNLAPGETGGGTDSFIAFTATKGGTYYAAVSGQGNQTYDAKTLSGRTRSATTGDYTISIDVQAPRTAYIDVNVAAFPTGSGFELTDVAGNTVIFRFGAAGAGEVLVPNGFNRRQDQAEAIRNAINGAGSSRISRLNNIQDIPNGVFGLGNPNVPVTARAYGGADGRGPAGSTRDSTGFNFRANSSPHYVEISNVANIRSLGVPVGPSDSDNGNNYIQQTGVFATERVTPTLINNIIANLDRGYVNVSVGDDFAAVLFGNSSVVAGTAFQNNRTGDTNVSGAGTDFNILLTGTEAFLENPGDRNYYPQEPSRVIDSSINVLEDRDDFATRIKAPLGLPASPIFAPSLDAVGAKRIDNTNVSSPQGLGDNVFKDRGALDVADFVTPTAELLSPRDNDSLGIDRDPAATVVQLADGVYSQFTVQITDQFGADNPFPGTGADDGTIQTMPVQVDEGGLQLTLNGPAVTLFEDGRFLREGFDYTFRYDPITDKIILTPLAGIWPDGRVYEIRLNNRDRFVVDAPNGGSILDGANFTITDRTGAKINFEFDSGYRLQVPQTLNLLVPVAGAGTGGVSDGQKFTVNDGKRSVTFEFDANGLFTAGNRRIPFTAGDSQDAIAAAIVNAINLAVTPPGNLLTGLAPRYLGNGVIHAGATEGTSFATAGSTLATNFTQVPTGLVVPAAGVSPGGIADGQTFRISNLNSGVTEIYEFDDIVNNPGVATGNIAIPFVPTATVDDLTNAVALVISSGATGVSAVGTSNGRVRFTSAQSFHIVDVSGPVALTRTMSIGGVNDAESIAARYAAPGGSIVRRVFEFDRDGVRSVVGSTLVTITAADTQADIAAKIAAAFSNDTLLALQPINFGGGNLQIGGTTDHVVDAANAPSLTLTGQPGVQTATRIALPVSLALQVPAGGGAVVPDGSLFTISNGVTEVVFELDNDFVFQDLNNDLVPDNTIIPFTTAFTQDQLAVAMLNAVQGANLGLSPPVASNPLNGQIILGSGPQHTVTLPTGSLFSQSLVVSGLVDGQSFTIDDGVFAQRFEFEDSTINNGVTPGSTPIFFAPRTLATDVADAAVAVIRNAALCTNFGTSCLGTTANIGGGVIELGDTGRHTTTISTATFQDSRPLVLSGVPTGAVPVSYRPDVSFSDAKVAQAIIDAIRFAASQPINVIAGRPDEFRLVGVDASLRGGSTVFVDFVTAANQTVDFNTAPASIAGISNFFLQGIQDVAGNLLRGNQPGNVTQFTILMPGVAVDYGDSPDPFTGPGRYPTLSGSDGARHTISTTNPLFLGQQIDGDFVGQSTPQANGDDTDLSFNTTAAAGLSVTGPAGAQILLIDDTGLNSRLERIAKVLDGETFRIFDGDVERTFEFDSDNATTDNRTIIPFSAGPALDARSTVDEIAVKIADAVRRAGLSITAQAISNGRVQFSSNDDDGVRFLDVFNAFLDTPITVTASGAGLLDAWIDYNQDGDWEDPGEQIFRKQAVVPGTNSFILRAPIGAAIGDTFARFRLSAAGGLLPTGLAVGGEVEDYRITVLGGLPPVVANDPRSLANPPYTTRENAVLDISAANGVLVNDTDDDSPSISVREVNGQLAAVNAVIAIASGAEIRVNADGSFRYDPTTSLFLDALAAGETFTDTFTYRATDGILPSAGTATVTITVNGENDPPIASNNVYAISEDTQLTGQNFVTGDTGVGPDRDPDNGDVIRLLSVNNVPLATGANVVRVLSSGATLTLIFNTTLGRFDGDFIYDPLTSPTLQALRATESASDSFTYTIADSSGATSVATVSLTIAGLNDVPTAPNRLYTTDEDTALSGQNLILGAPPAQPAATDPDTGETATLTLVNVNGTVIPLSGGPTLIALSSGARVTVNSRSGGFAYDPLSAFNSLRPGQSATDTFTYTLSDVNGAISLATVTVTIDGRNDLPIAVTNSYSTNDNATVQGRNLVTDNTGAGVDSDPDTGDMIRFGSVGGTVLAGTANQVVTLASGATFTAIYNTALGRFDGTFIYDPSTSATLNALQLGQTGIDTFPYQAIDTAGALSLPATVTITVSGANDPPIARDNFYPDAGVVFNEDTLLNGNVITDAPADSDPDNGDTAILQVISVNGIAGNVGQTITTANGAALRVTATGALSYDPRNSAALQALRVGQSGVDTFTYTISDSRGGLSTATVTITVAGANDAPIARPNSYSTDDNTPITGRNVITEAPADTDPDTGETALLVVSGVNGGGVGVSVLSTRGASVVITAMGVMSYDPTVSATLNALTVGQSLTDTFTYTIQDPAGATSTATVTVTVVGVNDPPVATNNSYTVDENSQLSQNVITDAPPDTDPDTGDTRTVSAVNGVTGNVGQPFTTVNGARVTINSNGALSYNPTVSATINALTTGQSVVDTFTYTIVDSRGATSTATVTVTVSGINDPPGLLNDDFTVNQDTPTTLDVLANDSDPEGPLNPASLQVVAGSGPTRGTATVVNGAILYSPNAGQTGADSFRYRVADSLGLTSEAIVTLTIRATPSPWQNQARPLDVNGDTFVTPIDALIVINLVNSIGSGPLAGRTPPVPTQPSVDTNGDGQLAPLDALLVINAINAGAGGEGAGEGESFSDFQADVTSGGTAAFAVLVDHRWSPTDATREVADATPRGSFGALDNATLADAAFQDGAFSDATVMERSLAGLAAASASDRASDSAFDRASDSESAIGTATGGRGSSADSGVDGESQSDDIWSDALDAILTDGI